MSGLGVGHLVGRLFLIGICGLRGRGVRIVRLRCLSLDAFSYGLRWGRIAISISLASQLYLYNKYSHSPSKMQVSFNISHHIT